MSEIAHLGPVELLTPKPAESLGFFADVLGMEIEGRAGQSVFLRGWGDYQRFSLQLTEAPTSGLRMLGLRAWSQEALERRVAAVAVRPTASATRTDMPSSCTTRPSATRRRPTSCRR